VEYTRKPFTAAEVSAETGIDIKYTIKMLVFLRETQVVEVISKDGKWNIYVKDDTPEELKRFNRYGYENDFMRKLLHTLIDGRYTSQRDLIEVMECTHHKIVYYMQAMASAGVIGVRDKVYTVTDSSNLGGVGHDVDTQVFRKLKKKAVKTPGVAVTA